MKEYAALSGRIRQALLDLERVVQRAEELMAKAQRTGDDGYLDGVALNLHGFYTGVERIFEDIAHRTGEGVPTGHDWHRSLLLQMAAAIHQVRPPVIRPETRQCLDTYRGFRHVVRNIYTFNLRPERLQELVKELRGCYEAVARDLNAFAEFLDRLALEAEEEDSTGNGPV